MRYRRGLLKYGNIDMRNWSEEDKQRAYNAFIQEKGRVKIMNKILEENKAEFLGQIIDAFDDFLEEKDIRIYSSDKEMIEVGDNPEDNAARIYGMDYGMLSDRLEALMNSWGIIEQERKGE